MGLSSTRACVCGTDIEDVDHYLFRCPKYSSIRSDLLKSVQDIVTYCTRSSNQGLTASLLLSPWNYEDASKFDCSEILAATFQFIHKSTRQLWAIHYLHSFIYIYICYCLWRWQTVNRQEKSTKNWFQWRLFRVDLRHILLKVLSHENYKFRKRIHIK